MVVDSSKRELRCPPDLPRIGVLGIFNVGDSVSCLPEREPWYGVKGNSFLKVFSKDLLI